MPLSSILPCDQIKANNWRILLMLVLCVYCFSISIFQRIHVSRILSGLLQVNRYNKFVDNDFLFHLIVISHNIKQSMLHELALVGGPYERYQIVGRWCYSLCYIRWIHPVHTKSSICTFGEIACISSLCSKLRVRQQLHLAMMVFIWKNTFKIQGTLSSR